MNTNNKNPETDPAAELRQAAVVEMLKGIKETFLLLAFALSPRRGAGRSEGDAAERAARTLATLKPARQALQTFPADKHVERALCSAQRAIQEQEKWLAECLRLE